MFNTWVDYPTYAEELSVVRLPLPTPRPTSTPSSPAMRLRTSSSPRMPIADNVLEYAGFVGKTRPGRERATDDVNAYLSWGVDLELRCSGVGAKVNAALNGKYSPDIEDVVR